jgi:uncharacterized protein (DUF1697 family)
MKKITLLRGINVSGQKKVKMEELRAMCEQMGYEGVKTYIQSGNIVFDAIETNTSKIAEDLRAQMLSTFGHEVKVIVCSQDYFEEVLENNPFLNDAIDLKFLHVTFFSEVPDPELVEQLEAVDYGTDEFRIVQDRAYLYFPNGYGRTKLTNNLFEKKLKTDATTRNWRSINKIYDLANS